jgi:hypothetical protein
MEKEFIPYELALRMKALGFDEPCFSWYVSENYGLEFGKVVKDNLIQDAVLAPTFSQAFRWFRDEHRIITEILFYNNGEEWEETEFKVTLNRFEDFATHNTFVKSGIKSYEEAELICIEKLIEIVELGKKWDELKDAGLDEPFKGWE